MDRGHARCLYQAAKVSFGVRNDVVRCAGIEEIVKYVAFRREISVLGLADLLGLRDAHDKDLFVGF